MYLECRTLNGCKTGFSKITRGYKLPAKHVIHTVGPVGENPDRLTSCYETILQLCLDNNIRTVAFCGISTGIFGYPLYEATNIACKVIRKWMEVPQNLASIDRIILCTFLDREEVCYGELMKKYFPPVPDPDFVTQYEKDKAEYQTEDDEPEPPKQTEVISETSETVKESNGETQTDQTPEPSKESNAELKETKETAKEDVQTPEPVKEDVQITEPVKENVQTPAPVKEDVQTTEPVKENVQAPEPPKEKSAESQTTPEPVKENVPTPELPKENTPVQQQSVVPEQVPGHTATETQTTEPGKVPQPVAENKEEKQSEISQEPEKVPETPQEQKDVSKETPKVEEKETQT
uniref:Macro domain-containing protein n=1 Tax=Arcella intermedia TaxID=1963864 RepID=A0A6B2L6B1_9EUKA